MDTTPTTLHTRKVRSAVALGAAALLVAGATWHGLAAEPAIHPPDSLVPVAQAQQTPAASRGAVLANRARLLR